MDELIKECVSHLKNNKGKLADEFQHLVYITVHDKDDKFPYITYYIDEEGRYLKVFGPDSPKSVMSTMFNIVSKNTEKIEKDYVNIAENYGISVKTEIIGGICQSPFKVYAYKLEGNETLIKKLTFSEKIRGERYFSLYKYMTEEKVNFIVKNYKKWNSNVFFYPFNGEVNIVFLMPKKYSFSQKALATEIGSIFKDKIILKYENIQKTYKDPAMKINQRILSIFKVKVEDILKYNFLELYVDFIKKIDKIIEDIENINF
ncbi:hypothetical protein OSSY52_07070 [Tepiditoga spiralis]|uniref:DUF4895 domain-containing protein n=1 Tax=Tepiditoga spiralis TaxID=2108365 RepID=A0A7G1G5K3_9BACT|nr:DUF4895 domain-containing protein [Tepiditoga spiralis]BBE30566.1 hypothetical protein OSSY52_07070 [Tepiditoga spiralis]